MCDLFYLYALKRTQISAKTFIRYFLIGGLEFQEHLFWTKICFGGSCIKGGENVKNCFSLIVNLSAIRRYLFPGYVSLKDAAQCKICRSRGPEHCKLLLWTELIVLVILYFHLHDVFFDARKVVAKAQWHTSQSFCNSEFCGCRCFQIHAARLRERGDYAEPMLLQSLERADTCLQHNRENPGFFDMAISSGKKLHGIHPSKQGNVFLFRRSNFYFIFHHRWS